MRREIIRKDIETKNGKERGRKREIAKTKEPSKKKILKREGVRNCPNGGGEKGSELTGDGKKA